MTTTINTGTRRIQVSERFVDDVGDKTAIALDVSEKSGLKCIYSDVPLAELLAALSKIPGVTASYEEPKPTTWEKIQALGEHAVIRLVHRSNNDPETFTYSRRQAGYFTPYGQFALSEDTANFYDVIVEFEGVK